MSPGSMFGQKRRQIIVATSVHASKTHTANVVPSARHSIITHSRNATNDSISVRPRHGLGYVGERTDNLHDHGRCRWLSRPFALGLAHLLALRAAMPRALQHLKLGIREGERDGRHA